MQEADLIRRYEAEQPLYAAWGRFVTGEISSAVLASLPAGQPLKHFLKVPPASRTKTVASLVGKAYIRGKNYVDPYAEITDKVGTRFVVLLLPDVDRVKTVVEASPFPNPLSHAARVRGAHPRRHL
jgi:putative GTP pyrophosphokinase